MQKPIFLAHLAEHGEDQQVVEHLLSVCRAARENTAKLGTGPAGALIGVLHDLGKYSGAFQKYLAQMAPSEDTETQELARGSVDHSTAGAQAIWERLKPKGARGQIAGEILAVFD